MQEIKKVVIIGPESTGKSTLTADLSRTYKEPWVPEYAREYLEKLLKEYQYGDLLQIAKGQIAGEEEKIKEADNILFCDTDLHVIKVWSDHKYGKTDPWILNQIQKRKYHLYLLTNIDVDWQDDPLREHPDPEMRKYFFDKYHQLMLASKTPFTIVSGSPTERLKIATEAVNRILSG